MRLRASSVDAPSPRRNTTLRVSPGASVSGTCRAAHGSSPAPTLFDSVSIISAAGMARDPLRPMNSVAIARNGSDLLTAPGKRYPSCHVGVVRIPGRDGPRRCIAAGDDRPLPPARGGPSSHSLYPNRLRRFGTSVGFVRVNTDAFTGASANTQTSRRCSMPVARVLERADAGPVPHDPGVLGTARQRSGRRPPHLAVVVVANVDRLRRRVGDRIVGERREAMLAAVDRTT